MKYLQVFIILFTVQFLWAQDADLIIYNASIYNHDRTNPGHQAIAIADGLIMDLGSNASIMVRKGPQTKVLDAKGQFLMPGLIEGHGHFHSMGKANLNLNLMGTKNWDEIINMVKLEVAHSSPGELITGRGWHQEKWDKALDKSLGGFPYHHSLSEVAPNNPVILRHASGHLLIANQKAMEEAGINSSTQSPSGGEIFIDKAGELTGIFNETAMSLFRPVYLQSTGEQSEADYVKYWEKCVKKAEEICLENGITSFQDAGSDFHSISNYRDIYKAKNLHIRLWVMINDDITNIRSDIQKHLKNAEGPYFKLGGIKVYIDGALGSRGAWLLEPYSDMPDSHGHRIISESDFDEIAKICTKNNLQLCTHAIGDRGNRVVFDTYEKWLDNKDRRWRVEHAQHLNPKELSRFYELGIIAAMQPIHCTSDAPFVEKRLGKKRAEEGAYVWRKILDSKARLNLGTDTPVEEINPFQNLYAACTRNVASMGAAFYPEQVLTRAEALYYYTMGNAYSVFEENYKGSLDKGKFADIIILDTNLLECSDDELLEAKVQYTIIGGDILYTRN